MISCHTGVCEKKHSFYASLGPATQQQTLLSSPRSGLSYRLSQGSSPPEERLFHRGVFLSIDTSISISIISYRIIACIFVMIDNNITITIIITSIITSIIISIISYHVI